MLPELQSLATLASSCPDVVLNVGEPDCNWSFNWVTRTITVNPTDLALRPPDYCRGLILHESAHAALTRFRDMVPLELYQAGIHPLLNVIEDCRIENWLQERFPGCRPWIRLYNDRILGSISDASRERLAKDPAGGFLSGLLDHWWNETSVLILHPDSQAALAQVMPYFEQAIAAYPSPAVPDATRTRQHYNAHPVSICYRAQDHDSEPSPGECVIRMLQHRAWSIIWQHIVPVFLRLLDHPDSEPTRQAIKQLAAHDAQSTQAVAASASQHNHSIEIIQHSSGRDGTRSQPGDANLTLGDGDTGDYAKVLARHAALIEACAATLLRLTGATEYLLMPARGVFALGVGHARRKTLQPGDMAEQPASMMTTTPVELTAEEWNVLLALKEELSLAEICENPWASRAERAAVSLERFCQIAENLNAKKVIGRFSTFLEHVKPSASGVRVTRFNGLFHWTVGKGREHQAGAEVGRHDCMTHCYWREGGPQFGNANIMGVVHGTEKSRVLEHKAAIDRHLQAVGIPVAYTNVFWGGRSEIKPSEISPKIYAAWHARHAQ